MEDDDRAAAEAEFLDGIEKVGRKPTTAHPLCICGKPQGGPAPLPKWLWADPNVPETAPILGQPRDCPQHK